MNLLCYCGPLSRSLGRLSDNLSRIQQPRADPEAGPFRRRLVDPKPDLSLPHDELSDFLRPAKAVRLAEREDGSMGQRWQQTHELRNPGGTDEQRLAHGKRIRGVESPDDERPVAHRLARDDLIERGTEGIGTEHADNDAAA